jgi:hypothetical protein
VCESRVSQLHSQAIASLRGQLAAHNEGVVLERDGIALEINPGSGPSTFSGSNAPKCVPVTPRGS